MSKQSSPAHPEEEKIIIEESKERVAYKVNEGCSTHQPPRSTRDKAKPDNSGKSKKITITFHDGFVRSWAGVLKFIQIICAVVGLVCVTSAGKSSFGSYLLLPLAWHLRVFVFVCTLAFMLGVILMILHSSSIIHMVAINWHLLDFVLYSSLSFGLLFGSSLVASAADFYHKLVSDVPKWTIEQLIISAVVGYLSMFLHIASAWIGFSLYRQESSQFSPRRFTTRNTSAVL